MAGARDACNVHALGCTQACLLVHYFTVRLFIVFSSSSLTVRLLERLPLFELESGVGAGWMFIFFRPSSPIPRTERTDGWVVRT
jgi:hypothetical protein